MGESFNKMLGAGAAAYGAYDAYSNAAKQRSAQTVGAQSQQARLGQFLVGSGLANQTASLTGDQMVAPLNADMLAGIKGIRDAQGMGQSDYAGAMTTARGVNANVSDADIARFMNPYTDSVVNTTLADIDRQRAQRIAGINSDAEAAGAFGGDRAEVAKALANESFDRTGAMTAAQLRSSGYDSAVGNALGLAKSNAGLTLAGNAQLQSLIDARRNAAQSDASSLIAAGGVQQSNDQAKLDWLKQRVGVALSPVQAFGGTQPYTGAVTSPTAAGAAGLVGGASQAGGIANLISSIFGGGGTNVDTGGYGSAGSIDDALYGQNGDFGSWLDGVLGENNTPGMPDTTQMSDSDLWGWMGGANDPKYGFSAAGGEAANGTIDPVTISQSKVPTTGSGLSFGKVGSGIGSAANIYAGLDQGGTQGYGKALASGAGLASSLGYGGTATNTAGLIGNAASGNYAGAAKNALSLFGKGADAAAASGASSGAASSAASGAASSGAGSLGGLSMGQWGGVINGALSLGKQQGKFAGTANMAMAGYQVGGPWGALVGAILGYAKEGGVHDANPWDASGFSGITMDKAWQDQNIARLASNPAASVASKLGVKSDSTLGKILDPSGLFSGHGDEKRNAKAFASAFPGISGADGGGYKLPDGTHINDAQFKKLAGTWYGATYHPDGDQQGWQKKFLQSLAEVYGQ
jgi:hypothetical protein